MIFKCKCKRPPFYHMDYETLELGEDTNYAYVEVTIDTCKKCGLKWLNYLIEQPDFTNSGRWWRAPIDHDYFSTLKALNAKEYSESQEWYFFGGSFYEKGIHKKYKPIKAM